MAASLTSPQSEPKRLLIAECAERDLAMTRVKPRSVMVSLLYRLKKLLQAVLGVRRVLRLCLNTSWLLRRFAYEMSCEIYGEDFQQSALALSDDVLERWIPARGSVIDIGCGTGRWCRAAARHGRRVVGIDYDHTNIEIARKSSAGLEIEYIVGDVTRDLGDLRFDTGLLIHVIEHIDDPDSLLRSLQNLVETLIVEVPDFDSDCLNVIRLELDCPFYTDGDHVREYTLPVLEAQLSRNGWIPCYSKHHGGAILVVARRSTGELDSPIVTAH